MLTSSEAAIPFIAQKLRCFDPEVSVIDCGSKFNLPLYMEIAGAFGLDHFVLHDEDPVDESLTGDELREARRTFAFNSEISAIAAKTGGHVRVVPPNFEGWIGVSKRQGEKKGKPLAAIDHLEELLAGDAPFGIRQLVQQLYLP